MASLLQSKMPLVYLVTSLHRSGKFWLGVVELFSKFATCGSFGPRYLPVRFSSYDYGLERAINGEGILSRTCELTFGFP